MRLVLAGLRSGRPLQRSSRHRLLWLGLHRLLADLSGSLSRNVRAGANCDVRAHGAAAKNIVEESTYIVAGGEAGYRRVPALICRYPHCLAEEMRDVLVYRYSPVEQVLIAGAQLE